MKRFNLAHLTSRWLRPPPRARSPAEEAATPVVVDLVLRDHLTFLALRLLRGGVQGDDLPDVIQEVLVVVHRRGPSFEPGTSVRAWLGEICRKTAANHRALGHLAEEVPTDFEDEEGFATEGAAQELLDRDEVDCLCRGLDDGTRRLVHRHDLEGMTCAEIAKAEGLEELTVKLRLAAARAHMRRAGIELRRSVG